MLRTRNSIPFGPLAVLGCFFIAACSGGGGKASPSVVGTSGSLTLIAQSSVTPPSDIGHASRPGT